MEDEYQDALIVHADRMRSAKRRYDAAKQKFNAANDELNSATVERSQATDAFTAWVAGQDADRAAS